MNKNKKKKSTKKTLIEYGIIAAVVIILYATGLHTEVIGFAQRGLLATGLLTPNVEKIDQDQSDENKPTATSVHTPADFNLLLMG